jgi:acyl-CoA synthetase (AMP-forming)/AMP-acid ligase II
LSQLVVTDHVSPDLRRRWADAGFYTNQDLFSLLVEQFTANPDRPVVADGDAELTAMAFVDRARAVASAFAEAGVARGDVVGIQMANGWRAAVADAAVAALGAVAMPFPPTLGQEDVFSLLARSGAVAVVVSPAVHPGLVPMLRNMADRLPSLRVTFADTEAPGTVSLQELMEGGPGLRWPTLDIDPDAPARIVVTSGTETAPKMIVVSANIISAVSHGLAAAFDPNPGWRHLLLSPMGSGLGMYGLWGTVGFNSGTLVLAADFDPAVILLTVSERQVTHITGVPTHYQMLLDSPTIETADLSSLRTVLCAGAGASPGLIREIRSRLCASFAQAYGASEGLASFCVPGDPPDKVETTVGRPLPGVCSVRIVDPYGQDLEPGCEGEVWGRGPFAPLGYVGPPEPGTSNRTPDGWVKSGDLGLIDQDGYLHIIGRIKDTIIRGGFNISARKIEDHLVDHPSIDMAACIGLPDRRLGEIICAFVTIRADEATPSLADIGSFLLSRGLAKNHLPERLEVISGMPLGPGGKIVKRALRERVPASRRKNPCLAANDRLEGGRGPKPT